MWTMQKTRELLIDVARQLFTLKGVARTTMSDIANASEKGRRTVYTYFKNKKEIYNAVIEEEADQMVSSLSDIMKKNIPEDEKLKEFLEIRFQRFIAPTAFASLKAWLTFDGRRLERVQMKARQKEQAMLNSLLDSGMAKGIFSPIRCKLLKDFVYTVLEFEDSNPPSEEEAQKRKHSIESFIKFVVTDITTLSETKI